MGIEAGTLSAVAAYTALAAAAASASASIYSGVTSYQAGKAAAKQYKSAAEAAEQQAAAEAYNSERQAAMEETQAGYEQISGEREAETRSRQLAADIGSTYAGFAGNGLLVDGGTAKDTVGSALRTTVAEADHDIGTIAQNASMKSWTHAANAGSYLASAGNSRIAGQNQKALYLSKAKSAKAEGRSILVGNLLTGSSTLGKGVSDFLKD